MKTGYKTTLIVLFTYPLLICSTPTVKTKFGELRGFLSEPLDSNEERAEIYLNIPYALPPLDELRFEVRCKN